MPRYALIIGISQYQNLASLPNAARDAEAVAQVLERHGNFDVVRRFPAQWKTAENCYEVAERAVSAPELIDTIKNFLLEQAQQGEGLIYYTGHGVTQTDPDTDERSGFLATSDYSPQQPGLSLYKFNLLIGRSQLSSLMVFLDCCHSGHFLEHDLLRQKLTSFNTSGDYYIVTASRQTEEAFYGEEHSVFTEALLKGLDRENADINGDISGDRLFDCVGRTLRQSGQEPLRMGWGRYITLLRYPPLEPIPAEHPFQTANPYRGLYTFEPEHADYFCGREEAVRHLTIRLLDSQVLTVIGPSGCGKSSLLRAGLLPELARDRLPGSSQWVTRLVMPSTHSFSEIAGLIAELTRSSQPYVLLIDQFEEIFTHWSQDSDRQRLLKLLADEVTREGSQARVIIAIRGDFLDRCATYPESATLVNRTQPSAYMVTPMTLAELHQAIARPATLHGVQFEEGLINAIAQDVLGQPGALPLLQYALKELWQVCIEQAESPTGQLTAEKYDAIGKVQGALNRRATILYRSFSEDDQALVRCLFKELVQIGDDNETVTRRRISWTRLRAIAPEARIEQMVCLLADQQQRLIIADEDWVQVAHEALLSEWDLLRSWITEDRDDIRLQRLLETDCHVWQTRFGESEEALLSGARLAKIAEWIERTQPRLLPEEEQFVQLSLDKRDRDLQTQLEQERQLREIAEAKAIAEIKRRQTTLRAGTLVITLILVLAGTIIHSIQQINRKNQEITLRSITTNAETALRFQEPLEALQHTKKALEFIAEKQGPNTLTPPNLLKIVSEVREINHFSYENVLVEVTLSPNDQLIAAGGLGGKVKVWPIDSPTNGLPVKTFEKHQEDVWVIDIASDNNLIASGDKSGTVWVWNIQGNDERSFTPFPNTKSGNQQSVVGIKFMPGNQLAFVGSRGDIRIQNHDQVNKNSISLKIPTIGQIKEVEFDKLGHKLAVADEKGNIFICQLLPLQRSCKALPKTYDKAVYVLAFINGSEKMISIGENDVMRFWDLRLSKSTEPILLKANAGAGAVDAAISSDDSKVFISDLSKNLMVFNLEDKFFLNSNPVQIGTLISESSSVQISSDASFAVSAGRDDKKIRLWAIRKNEKIRFEKSEKTRKSLDKIDAILTLKTK